jgi:hypothetical protein
MNLDEDLIAATTALKVANAEYIRARDAWNNLTSGTSEKDEAKEAKDDAKWAVDKIQAQIDQILEEKKLILKKVELELPLKIKKLELVR